MSEPNRILPRPFDRPESPAETTPISGPDAEALAIIERAAMEMAGRRPPKRAPEPAPESAPMFSSTFAEDAPVLNAKPANDSAPWAEMKPPEEIIAPPAVKSVDVVLPVELSPLEAPAPANEPTPNEPASWVVAELPEKIIPSAEVKPANDVRPIEIDPVVFDPVEADTVETPAPAEPIKPAAEITLVEQFDAAMLVHPAVPVAPVAPAQAKAAPPAVRPMFDDQFRLSLTNMQSASAAIAIFAFVIAALGMAASGWATAHDWTCRVGLATTYCPAPPVPKPLALPDIPS